MEALDSLPLSATPDSLARSFGEAHRATGLVSEEVVVGGDRVLLRFGGLTVRDSLFPAFAHLAARGRASTPPTLTIDVWDSASSGSEQPPLPPTPPSAPAGALYHFREPPLFGAYQPGLGALSVFDSTAATAWYWVADVRELPSWEVACPFRQLLFWWLRSRGNLQVHAAAVGTARAGALIVGPAGAGKSTVALSCLGSSLLYAGDDYVGVGLEPPRVISLYGTGKLDGPHLGERLPQLEQRVVNRARIDDEKAVIDVGRDFPQQATSGFPLSALVIPRIGAADDGPRIAPASRATALAALAPTTMFQLHTGGREELSRLSALVARLPCFSIDVGGDTSAVPEAIRKLLSTL
jgi:hypothetical protein